MNTAIPWTNAAAGLLISGMALMSIVFPKTKYNFLYFRAKISYHQQSHYRMKGHYQMITVLGKLWKITEFRALNLSALGLVCIWPYEC